ncbi:MAG TPA: ATP-binding protein [Firmicutes bacterium]|jgi:energy-coupling factor transporter ATP-binding protein EcfA2|nr:ATP-binding protein [Bacillota bacterium]
MLTSMILKNFTVFPDVTFDFGNHLNVFVGENGSGKSHVLKAAYAAISVSARGEKESGAAAPTKAYLQGVLARKLNGVFKPDELGRLVRRQAGRNRCEVGLIFQKASSNIGFSFHTASKTEVTIDKTPLGWEKEIPVFLPTRELLTIYPGFVSLYETTDLPFEETWRDTCLLLGAPLAKGPRLKSIKDLLIPLENAMGGSVELESGRFYLKTDSGRMEVHLVAEGLRKLAMIARLIATGSLLDKGYLFWDEPEANLNPLNIKKVANTILQLSKSGIQVFISTHSLFLMRELFILQQTKDFKDIESRYFGLQIFEDGVNLKQGPSLDDIGNITSLEEELTQSNEYMELE